MERRDGVVVTSSDKCRRGSLWNYSSMEGEPCRDARVKQVVILTPRPPIIKNARTIRRRHALENARIFESENPSVPRKSWVEGLRANC